MTGIDALGLALGAAFASGLNVYATVAVLGLLHRYDVVALPQQLAVLANPVVLGVAVFLYAVEFFADKIPYVDNVWDAVHTFIRPPAAAVLAWSAMGGVPEHWRMVAALVAGGIALTSHGAKASARIAANATPEPFTNWALSLGEDALVAFLTWMAVSHPLITLVLVAILLIVSVYVIVKLYHAARRLWQWVGGAQGVPPAGAPAKG